LTIYHPARQQHQRTYAPARGGFQQRDRTRTHPEIYTQAPSSWTSCQTRFASCLMRSCT
jgi:hypothetical protein